MLRLRAACAALGNKMELALIDVKNSWLTDTFIAHRGLFDNRDVPENSVAAFTVAAKRGFAIETDVQLTADGQPVVFHDVTAERMTGQHLKIADCTLDELRKLRLLDTDEKIPTFDEFLQAADGANIVVEIKAHVRIGETERCVADALEKYSGHCCVQSFDPFVVRWFRKNAPDILRGQLACDLRGQGLSHLKANILRKLLLCRWNGSQFISYDVNGIRDKAVQKYRSKMPLLCWTIKNNDQYESMRDSFDNMIFDSFVPDDCKNG